MGNDPVNCVDEDGGSIGDAIGPFADWAFGNHLAWGVAGAIVGGILDKNHAQGAAMGFAAGFGISYTDPKAIGNAIGNAGNWAANIFQNGGANILQNISLVIPSNATHAEREQAYHQMDGKNDGDWHFITARNLVEGAQKVARYLRKAKANNIVLDDHGGYVEGTKDPTVIADENNVGLTRKNLDNYPNNSTTLIKSNIDGLINIGNHVTINGNFVILSCFAGGGSEGTMIGKRISSFVGGPNVYLNSGFSRPTLLSLNIGGTGLKASSNIGGNLMDKSLSAPGAKFKQFNGGSFTGTGDINLSKTGQVLKFSN